MTATAAAAFPHRADYLNKVVPFTIPKTAVGQDVFVSVGPDQGQYWMPKIVRIALSSDTIIDNTSKRTPTAQLFYGIPQQSHIQATAGLYDSINNYGVLLDQTRDGFRDSTGVVSGMIISPGERLTVVWRNVLHAIDTNGAAVDGSATIQVLGISTSAPPSVAHAYLPETMGPHFNGAAQPDVRYAPQFCAPLLFSAPGPGLLTGASPVLTAGASGAVQLFAMQWSWDKTTVGGAQVSGQWILENSSGLGTQNILGYDTYNINRNGYVDFGGMVIQVPGTGGPQLFWKQLAASPDIAGSVDGAGMLIYSPYNGV